MFISTFFEAWLVYLIGLFLLILVHVPRYSFILEPRAKQRALAKSAIFFIICTVINMYLATNFSVILSIILPILVLVILFYIEYLTKYYPGVQYFILTILLSLIFACNAIF